jgi:hypothetical protein
VYYNKNVIRGNTAVLKCTIPGFVREYITVTSWVQDSKFNIYPTTKGGKLSLPRSILYQHNLFNHFISRPSTCQEILNLPPQTIFHITHSYVTCQVSTRRDCVPFLLKQTAIGYVLYCVTHYSSKLYKTSQNNLCLFCNKIWFVPY